jgi:hypothetical protein
MDYRCLQECQKAGFKHAYCEARCGFENRGQSVNPAAPSTHGTDYRCVDKCTGNGRPRASCVKNCTY